MIVLSCVLLARAALSIAVTRFESDIFKLFPARQGALRLFLDSLKWTGSVREGALASIGWATNYGIGATTLFTLVSLPALMPIFTARSRGK